MQIVLYEPEIPQNTGNIIRLCANAGVSLSLIEPLGFSMVDKQLRRAGLDYHEYTTVRRYADWSAFHAHHTEVRLVGFSSKASMIYDQWVFNHNDVLIFGPETRGLSKYILSQCQATLRIPMQENSRSLNLANSVAIAVYEGMRQSGFQGLV